MKTLRMWKIAIAALVVVPLMLGPAAAQAPPVRSGTIVVALNQTWLGTGCAASAECSAWLRSGCPAALAGKDPSLSASIVDVRGLAGSRVERSLRVRTPYSSLGLVYPEGPMVELWGPRCERLYADDGSLGYRFRIPATADWMTVATGRGGWLDIALVGAAVSWELR